MFRTGRDGVVPKMGEKMDHLLTVPEEQETDELTSSDDSDDDFGKFVGCCYCCWDLY